MFTKTLQYYQNRLDLLKARKKDNNRVRAKIQRKIYKLQKTQ